MKRILLSTAALGIAAGVSGCMNLDEKLISGVSSDYYATPDGLNSALIASYSQLRGYYGREQLMSLEQVGTDTWMAADQAGSNNREFDAYNGGLTSQVGPLANTWNPAYQAINTLNAALDRGPELSGVPEATKLRLLAEAHFLRAFNYFKLVRFFGDVTLTLHENKGVQLEAVRDPAADVYAAILADLDTAVAGLPNTTTETGRATKGAALALRSQVYLTRAYKSYSPSAQADYQAAFNDANEVIENRSVYGYELEPNFANLFCIYRASDPAGYCDTNGYTENHKEFIFTVRFGPDGITYNAANFDGGDQYNYLNLVYLSQYDGNGLWKGTIRDINNGRPFRRAMPTPYNMSLWNKWVGTPGPDNHDILDTRFDATFQTVWKANTAANPGNLTSCNRAAAGFGCTSGEAIAVGDTAAVFLPYGVTNAYRLTKKYYILTPCNDEQLVDTLGATHVANADTYSHSGCGDRNGANDGYVNWQRYPSLKKYQDNTRPTVSTQESGKVQVIIRLGEMYLIRAEAALALDNKQRAADDINILHDRAKVGGSHANDPTAYHITANDVTLDYIMEERERELAGEHTRWMDITRPGPQYFLTRVKAYNPHAAPNIKDYHYLRPIPQGQIDGVTLGTKYPQNPGY